MLQNGDQRCLDCHGNYQIKSFIYSPLAKMTIQNEEEHVKPKLGL